MPSPTLFVSDLHLDPDRVGITTLFLQFLQEQATRASALYILGDLFEVWVGDDDRTPHSQSVTRALRTLSQSGVAVYLMHGNRDFLLGPAFAAESGAQLIPDPTVVDLYGEATLLMHGDTLCTDDLEYQAFRAKVREPQWQQEFLSKPLEERHAIVDGLRADSREQTGNKPEQIMDVNAGAVAQALRRQGVTQLIHGHTHRPAIHLEQLDGQPTRRIVLGDWYKTGSVLYYDRAGPRLEVLTPPE